MRDKETARKLEHEKAKYLHQLRKEGYRIPEYINPSEGFQFPYTKEELLKEMIIHEALSKYSKDATSVLYESYEPNSQDDEKFLWAIEKLYQLSNIERLVSSLFAEDRGGPHQLDRLSEILSDESVLVRVV